MLVYGKYEWFVMHMFHVCVLCTPCGNSQSFRMTFRLLILVEDARCSKRHSLQATELLHRSQTAVQIVSNLPAPIYRFLGKPAIRTCWMVGAALHKSG